MTPASMPDLNQTLQPDRATIAPPDGLQQSVQSFFQQINWEDHPSEIYQSRQAAIDRQSQPLSLLLTANQFFQAIPWEDNTGTGPPNLPVESSPTLEASNPFTLEDFSDLF